MEMSKNDPFVKIMDLSEAELENKLLQGHMRSEFQAFLGTQEYQELRDLVQEASARSVRGGERVLILPGIMGSRLAVKEKKSSSLVWLEPISLLRGDMAKLAFSATGVNKVVASGVISIYYLKLKLLLRLSGYHADYFAYDWRLSVLENGKLLGTAIRAENHGKVSLIGHSMGGLVARAMLAVDSVANKKMNRLIMLGTPHEGSFAAITTLRGTGSSIQKLGKWIDQKHTVEELVTQVVGTFPGIHELLPSKTISGGHDIYSLDFWQGDYPKPHKDHLAAAATYRMQLAPADDRFYQISGVDQETVVSVTPGAAKFEYESNLNGDGTVPLTSAQLAGARQYYTKAEHGSMANNYTIYRAIKDILAHGDTERLARNWENHRAVALRKQTDEDLRQNIKTDTEVLGMEDLVDLPGEWLGLSRDGVAGMSAVTSVVAPVNANLDLRQLSVARRQSKRLEIRLAHGSIADVDARAYVLGIFNGVTPMGAARALDQQMDGVIDELTKRRMFHGNVGELFMLPVNRRRLLADFVVFVGLGTFDAFDSAAQELAGENITRNLVQTYIEEFATVLVGAGSGKSIHHSLKSLLSGFLRGLQDADNDNRFRRITLCEYDANRFALIKDALYNLAGTDLFGEVEVYFDEVTLPKPVERAPLVARRPEEDPIYLILRREEAGNPVLPAGSDVDVLEEPDVFDFHASLLGAGEKASVMTDFKTVSVKELNKLLKPLDNHSSLSFQKLKGFGETMAELLLPESTRTALANFIGRPLVIVNDSPASRLPWEALKIGDSYPALNGGIVRRLLAGNMSVAKWLESRREEPILRILLVVNPTLDLDGAQAEGEALMQTFNSHPEIEIDVLQGNKATKRALMKAFSSGKYDVLHYAGHAVFFPENPTQSGLLCANNAPLRGEELTSLGSLPMLMVFNACEAGRVRGMRDSVEAHIRHKVGFAEAFLRGGVANYVGTYWPVGDRAAADFAKYFYGDLLKGETIGVALNHARRELYGANLNEWANYIHYGGFDYRLKKH